MAIQDWVSSIGIVIVGIAHFLYQRFKTYNKCGSKSRAKSNPIVSPKNILKRRLMIDLGRVGADDYQNLENLEPAFIKTIKN